VSEKTNEAMDQRDFAKSAAAGELQRTEESLHKHWVKYVCSTDNIIITGCCL